MRSINSKKTYAINSKIMLLIILYKVFLMNSLLIFLIHYVVFTENSRRKTAIPCFAQKTSDVSCHSRKVWVDSERWLPLKEERYANSGRLLNTMEINEVFQVEKRWYPKKMTFKDMLSKGKGTEYIIESIDFNVKIPDHMLTKAALRQ